MKRKMKGKTNNRERKKERKNLTMEEKRKSKVRVWGKHRDGKEEK